MIGGSDVQDRRAIMDHARSDKEPLRSLRLSDDASIFKALGDEKRLRIMHQIASQPGICSCKVLAEHEMSQSTLSHHMKLLCKAGLVKCEKDGKWVHYTLDPDGLGRAAEALSVFEEAAR